MIHPTDLLPIRKPHKYGWVRDLPDFRDFLASPMPRIAGPRPAIYSMRTQMPPVYDQGQIGSCTGNATSAAIDYNESREGRPFITPSRLFIYYNARAIEGSTASDAGASVRDVIKGVATLGTCTEVEWPYNPVDVVVTPSAKSYADALPHVVTNYASVGGQAGPSVDDLCEQLAGGEPIVFGISVYDSFESDAVAATGLVPMPGINDKLEGGHCVLIVGYDDSRKLFEIRNSWGCSWGDNGYFWLPYEYVVNPNLASDFWVVRNIKS
jgi:C1A family cysteine protease